MRRNMAQQMALCGLLGALAVVIMLLGGLIPVATFCCPLLAALLMVPVLHECGKRLALVWYGAVAVLSCLLGPDKEAAAIYAFLGYYPVLKEYLDRYRCLAGFLAKLSLFNAAICVMYALLLFVFGLEGLMQEFSGMGVAMLAASLVLGNVAFFLFDALLPKMMMLYCNRLRHRIWRRGR